MLRGLEKLYAVVEIIAAQLPAPEPAERAARVARSLVSMAREEKFHKIDDEIGRKVRGSAPRCTAEQFEAPPEDGGRMTTPKR